MISNWALARVPELRKISIHTVIVTVTLLVLAAIFQRLTVAFAVLATMALFRTLRLLRLLQARKRDRKDARVIWVRILTPKTVKVWCEAGKLTKEEYEK